MSKDFNYVGGFNEQGIYSEAETEFDSEGYDKNGYNRKGFNREGIHIETGTRYNMYAYDCNGYNQNGFD